MKSTQCGCRLVCRYALVTLSLLGLSTSAFAVDAAKPTSPVGQPAGAYWEQMLEAFYNAFGNRHVRATHAKGIVAVGDYVPSP